MEQLQVSEATQAASFSEKRSEHRRRTLKTATLSFNNGYASYGCMVRNLNDNGAMVEMSETTGIPQSFDFGIKDQDKISASIVWRDSKRLGLQFTQ